MKPEDVNSPWQPKIRRVGQVNTTEHDLVPPNDIPAPEPTTEEFHRAALELQSEPEHVAITAIKSGIAGLALAVGILAAPPGYAQVTLPTPIPMTETVKEIPSALEVTPTGRESDPPDPSLMPSLPPFLTPTSLGARIYDAGQTLSGIHADLFGAAASPAHPWIIAEEPQNRAVAPSGVVSPELPDWFAPSTTFGSAAQHGPGNCWKNRWMSCSYLATTFDTLRVCPRPRRSVERKQRAISPNCGRTSWKNSSTHRPPQTKLQTNCLSFRNIFSSWLEAR